MSARIVTAAEHPDDYRNRVKGLVSPWLSTQFEFVTEDAPFEITWPADFDSRQSLFQKTWYLRNRKNIQVYARVRNVVVHKDGTEHGDWTIYAGDGAGVLRAKPTRPISREQAVKAAVDLQDNTPHLRVRDMQALLHCTRFRIRTLIDRGQLRAVCVRRKILIEADSVRAFLQSVAA